MKELFCRNILINMVQSIVFVTQAAPETQTKFIDEVSPELSKSVKKTKHLLCSSTHSPTGRPQTFSHDTITAESFAQCVATAAPTRVLRAITDVGAGSGRRRQRRADRAARQHLCFDASRCLGTSGRLCPLGANQTPNLLFFLWTGCRGNETMQGAISLSHFGDKRTERAAQRQANVTERWSF